jgi:hypothetical protein
MSDPVNHPPHYNFGKYEVIDVIEDWQCTYFVGNSIKYLARYRYKGKPIEDLKKAAFYLDREIKRLEREQAEDEKRMDELVQESEQQGLYDNLTAEVVAYDIPEQYPELAEDPTPDYDWYPEKD